MSRILKIAILWLLVFALPMQGFASSGMLDCGIIHEHLVPHSSVHEEGSVNLGQEHQIHHHEQFSLSDDHKDVADGSDALTEKTSTDSSHHHGSTKCSICASCCPGTAISSLAILDSFASLQTGLEPNFHLVVQFTVYVPEGLERPPHSLAI